MLTQFDWLYAYSAQLTAFFKWLNNDIIAVPATIVFLGAAVILTIKAGFLQLRPSAIKKFFGIIFGGPKEAKATAGKTINPFHALFAAMATTIGMGNIVGPSVAILLGGPGALFWLVVYIFFGAATKFTEVVFALHTREKTASGKVIGGPMKYLALITPALATWYMGIMLFVFMAWNGLQANTLAGVLGSEGVPTWIVASGLGGLVLFALSGGAKRVGDMASKLVPLMFILYVSSSLIILLKNPAALYNAFSLVLSSAFKPAAATGAFFGASVLHAMRYGMYKGIFVTEAGVGTSAIAHAVSDVQKPTDQGLLALFSMTADALLCTISGMLVLVTGVWTVGEFRNTLVYEAISLHAPGFGQYILIFSMALFIVTTIIGNSFNGAQTFASLTRNRWVKGYIVFFAFVVFSSAFAKAELIWECADTLMALAAVPNLLGLVWLAFKKPEVLRIK